MKVTKIVAILLIFVVLFPVSSCEDFDKMNEDPNNPSNVSSNYILTWVLVEMAKEYTKKGYFGESIAGAMQYTQRGTNYQAERVNNYQWSAESWETFYNLLRNVQIINDNSKKDGNKMFEGISLTLRAFLFGTVTDLYGDCPYSESLKANQGIYFPKYDAQIDVYKGVLEDLRNAEQIFGGSDIGDYAISASADVVYGGKSAQWRKFANSLRLRYCMRLTNKKADMSGAGVDIVADFNDAASKAFTENKDDAIVAYIGTTKDNSNNGGPLASANPPVAIKPCKTILDYLRDIKDPRFYRWFQPVEKKWDFDVTTEVTKTITTMLGEKYTVTYIPTTNTNLDTSLYVGLPMGLKGVDATAYNKGTEQLPNEEKSPYVSYMHERFRKNSDTYLRMEIIMYPEVEFLLAEAAAMGGFSVSGSAEEHYKKGMIASLARWGIASGSNGFDFDTYYNNTDVSYAQAANKIERIMEQKWVALWLNVEPWFDWRRTGYPDLKPGAVAVFGPAIPIRYQYPTPSQDPQYLVNYNVGVSHLVKSQYVPAEQTADHPYSKMWLLEGTGIPY